MSPLPLPFHLRTLTSSTITTPVASFFHPFSLPYPIPFSPLGFPSPRSDIIIPAPWSFPSRLPSRSPPTPTITTTPLLPPHSTSMLSRPQHPTHLHPHTPSPSPSPTPTPLYTTSPYFQKSFFSFLFLSTLSFMVWLRNQSIASCSVGDPNETLPNGSPLQNNSCCNPHNSCNGSPRLKYCDTPEEVESVIRSRDPNRPPWPVLHHRATQMREGKLPLTGVQELWEATAYYYPADWLIPLELAQVLKYTTGRYLKRVVRDPEGFRRELMVQLIQIKHGRVRGVDRVSGELWEILSGAIEELSRMDFRDMEEIPIAPTHR